MSRQISVFSGVEAIISRLQERGTLAAAIELQSVAVELLEWADTALEAVVNTGAFWTPQGRPVVDLSSIEEIQGSLHHCAQGIQEIDLEGEYEYERDKHIIERERYEWTPL